jgi:predicted nucleic acid-binding protein
MCLIVDSNSVSGVFLKTAKEFVKLHSAVTNRKIKIVYGGELTREYKQMANFWRLLAVLDRQGSTRKVDDMSVERETKKIAASGICRSDDPHILALARVGRVRLICTEDQNLREDIRNPNLLTSPRGNVYNVTSHYQLLRKHCSS